ncbi:AAA family ATPase [Microbaculum sp. FT89]|uniref:AAA family ATPase n=1 Tax=Microbaculum sp. FT89 TaxID=3447298 RepID=UPI003F536290
MSVAAEKLDGTEAESPATGRQQDRYIPPLPRVSIQVFCETPETNAAFSEAASDRRASRAHMTVQMGGLAAAREFYVNAATPNVVVVESTAGSDGLLEQLDRLADVCDAGTRVIVIGHANDIGLYRKLIQKGVSDYVLAPINPVLALSALSSLFDVPGTDPLGRTIAFVGAKGGVGSSTIAHNVGWAISQELISDVVIADLDLAFGTAGLDFNQDPPQGMAEAVFARERLDENYLDRLFSKCTDHLSLIAAPSTLDKEYDLPGDSMEPVIELIRKTVPTVILDVPHLWTTWAKATLLGADEIVITAMPDLANLRNAKNLLDMLKQSRPNDRPPVVVLNQVGVPKKPEISEKDFAAALELDIFATATFDPVLFANAANNGQMIAETQANAKPVEMFRSLAEALTGRSEVRKAKRSPLGPLLKKLSMKKS